MKQLLGTFAFIFLPAFVYAVIFLLVKSYYAPFLFAYMSLIAWNAFVRIPIANAAFGILSVSLLCEILVWLGVIPSHDMDRVDISFFHFIRLLFDCALLLVAVAIGRLLSFIVKFLKAKSP